MKILKVDTKKQLRHFVRFPWKVYSKFAHWVPPLIMDTLKIFSESENPFWMHAKRQLFLAYDNNNSIVGRIAAIIDYNYVSFQDDKCGFFGFFECVDDVKVAKALFLSAQNWLVGMNINKMIGPMNPSTNDECGFLLDGFDSMPRFMMSYTPRYYLRLAEDSGLNKIKELYAYDMNIVDDLRVVRLERVVIMVKKKIPMLRIRNIQKKTYKEDLEAVMSIYNRAWIKNWGFVPWSDEEFASIASKLKMLINFDMALIASVGTTPVGMLVSLPDYNQILKKLNGRLFPFGIFKFLYYRKKIDNLRLMIMGVIKDYRHKGIEIVMYEKALKNAIRLGYKNCELSWVLDDNTMTQRTAEMMNGKIYKKYAIYSN